MSKVINLIQDRYTGPFPREFSLFLQRSGEGVFKTSLEGLSRQRRLEELRTAHIAINMAIVMLEIEIAERFGVCAIPGKEASHGDQ